MSKVKEFEDNACPTCTVMNIGDVGRLFWNMQNYECDAANHFFDVDSLKFAFRAVALSEPDAPAAPDEKCEAAPKCESEHEQVKAMKYGLPDGAKEILADHPEWTVHFRAPGQIGTTDDQGLGEWCSSATDEIRGCEKCINHMQANYYPHSSGMPVLSDPTHGRVDQDIQWEVHEMKPSSLGQRVALENTITKNRRREAGHNMIAENCVYRDSATMAGAFCPVCK